MWVIQAIPPCFLLVQVVKVWETYDLNIPNGSFWYKRRSYKNRIQASFTALLTYVLRLVMIRMQAETIRSDVVLWSCFQCILCVSGRTRMRSAHSRIEERTRDASAFLRLWKNSHAIRSRMKLPVIDARYHIKALKKPGLNSTKY
jgi:hypothetical protein